MNTTLLSMMALVVIGATKTFETKRDSGIQLRPAN